MNEKEIGQNIARTLNLGLDQLDHGKLARLHAARQRGDAICAFPHEREERIQAGDAA